MHAVISFIIGFMIGGFFGVLTLAVLVAGRGDDQGGPYER